MPVDLLNFKASKYGSDKVILNWATINEDNASHFIIERSYDGLTNFEQIGNPISAKGLGSNISYYNEIDNNPNITGKNYYRLVQYDKNGASKYYSIVLVDFNDKNSIFITYGDNGSIILNSTADVKTVRVIDILGREVSSYYNNTDQHLEVGNSLSDGTYIVQVLSNTKELNIKIIKK